MGEAVGEEAALVLEGHSAARQILPMIPLRAQGNLLRVLRYYLRMKQLPAYRFSAEPERTYARSFVRFAEAVRGKKTRKSPDGSMPFGKYQSSAENRILQWSSGGRGGASSGDSGLPSSS